MLIRNFSLSLINNLKPQNQLIKSLRLLSPNFNNQTKFLFSEKAQSKNNKSQQSLTTYVPIRPLKKYLTPLFVDQQYLNKKKIMGKIPFWPFFTPFFAMIVNNFLTAWTITNTSITSLLFVAGFILKMQQDIKRQGAIIMLQSNKQLTKLYMTVHSSFETEAIEKQYPNSYKPNQQWNLFTEQDYRNTEYIPTQADKKTFTQQELLIKKRQFDQKLLAKILRQQQIKGTLTRLQLDVSKTLFKFSNHTRVRITDKESIHPPIINLQQMLTAPYQYLIIRTEFKISKRQKNHSYYYIDLERNGDLKYQDYLIALGANYKISLDSELK